MTIREPEIVLGGGDPAPSAPPLSFNSLPDALTPPFVTASAPFLLPTAVATPIGSAPAPTTVENTGATIEQSTNADGSLSVKLTTATPQPNGYREIKIEYFTIPASTANSVRMALDAGEMPSSLYMTKMEQQVLPPGTGEVISHAPTTNTATPATGTHQPATSAAVEYDSGGVSGPRACAMCCGVTCCVFVILGILGGSMSETSSHSNNSPSSPSYPSYPSTPSYPSYPSPSFPSTPSFPSAPAFGLTQRPHPSNTTAYPTDFLRGWGITPPPANSIQSPTPPSGPNYGKDSGGIPSPTTPKHTSLDEDKTEDNSGGTTTVKGSDERERSHDAIVPFSEKVGDGDKNEKE